MLRLSLFGIAFYLAGCVAGDAQPTITAENQPGLEDRTPTHAGVAQYAKAMCSATFISGRDLGEATRYAEIEAVFMGLSEGQLEGVEASLDRERQEVRATLGASIERRARFYGDQGCVIIPQGAHGAYFTPVTVTPNLPDADTQPWPMGDLLADEPLPAEVDVAMLEAAVETAFNDPEELTGAFLVVYKGRIIAERYAPGIDKDTRIASWSMNKSLTSALTGALIHLGEFDLYDPAPVRAWQAPGDPRSRIRVADLLRMSSGLTFTSSADTDEQGLPYFDHFHIYIGAVNVFEYVISRPPEFAPNTVGRYRNTDPLTLQYLVKEAALRRGEEYLAFPQRILFDRIGIRGYVMEPDPYGNFISSGYGYGSARHWARLGMLFLQDGVWEGERVLAEGFVDFVRTPAPAWDEPDYGGLLRLNLTGSQNLPEDTFFMTGAGVQRTFIVPSYDLVIVRLAKAGGTNYPAMEEGLQAGLAGIIEAINR